MMVSISKISKNSKVGGLGESGCRPLFAPYFIAGYDLKKVGANNLGESGKKEDIHAYHMALVQEFLEEEKARGRRTQGVAGLKARLPWFIRFMEGQEKCVDEVRLSDARAYQGSLASGMTHEGKNYSMRTVASYVGVASAFCSWLERTGRALDNPFASLHRVRTERTIPENIPDEKTLSAILDELATWQCAHDLKAASRRYLVHVVAETQYASGLRIAEAAALKAEDVDLDRAYLYVRDGKKGSHRIAFLTDYAVALLELYLASGRSAIENEQRNGATLFLMGRERLARIVNEELFEACARAQTGSEARPQLTSHGLRHALGYHLLRAGCPLRSIQAILGHARIGNTEIYTRVDVADVKSVFDACHPRMAL